MIVRSLNEDLDWSFGRGRNDYISGNNAIAQSLATRLRSFLGDCFFDVAAGLDWFNLLGSKNQVGLNLAIKAIILNTPNVLGVVELSINLTQTRYITLSYAVKTVYPGVLRQGLGFILTEEGNILVTEEGDQLHA